MDPAPSTPAPRSPSSYTPPSDPSKYIRTYAKDVAELTHTAVPVHVAPPVPQTIPKQAEDGVSLPEFDASPIYHKDDPSSPKEFKQEVVELNQSDSEGIFKGPDGFPPGESLIPQGTIQIKPNVQPFGSTFEPAKDEIAEREAVLARLRAKLSGAVPTAHPEPAVLEDRPPISESDPAARFVPPVLESFQIPQTSPEPPAAEASPIHTYSSDFSDRIDQQKSSTFSVLAAQSDAQIAKEPPKPRNRPRTLIPLLAGAVMLVIGIGAITSAYIFLHQKPTTVLTSNVPSLIRFDESAEISGTGNELLDALAKEAAGGNVSGNVIVTYVTNGGAGAASGIPQPGGVLIRNLQLSAPDILLRNIDDSSTVGVIKAGTESRPFFILKVTSYERTFAGMLAWEPNLLDSLSELYPAYGIDAAGIASTTSSAVPTFTDAVVANHDVRVLRDSSGRSLVLYGYAAKDILIIARDEAAFTELSSRLTATSN